MARKELFKSLIALNQAELPFERIERETILPSGRTSHTGWA